ncbi:nickel-dependent hydrogenase large subunit [Kyrpidia spormannii]|uniref:nickel-dependent hydrogenase large subunit n=1 Tax=Kyrpidia spormannii TaxID=2055160 RepID=UPI001C057923|nr:nickel-dependent hydrogenase large subunit [Kyrpidia spormannii]
MAEGAQMSAAKTKGQQRIRISPAGRVEGDLDFEVDIKDGRVTRAEARAVMFRGFEKILKGKDSWLGITMTPRICGICGIGHITSAVKLVDMASGNGIGGVDLPIQARIVRNIVGSTESHMSGIRHHWLLFGPDMVNEAYSGWSEYEKLKERMQPFTGTSYRAAVAWSKKVVEITAIFAGQQPHPASFVPGGVTSSPTLGDITKSLGILQDVREHFIEKHILHGKLEDYLAIRTWEDLQEWLGRGDHEDSDLGLFIRQALHFGWHTWGRGTGYFLGYPSYETEPGQFWYPGGLYSSAFMYNGTYEPVGDPLEFQQQIMEHHAHSFYQGEGPFHPSQGQTEPIADLQNPGDKYSFAKAPRFRGLAVEVGPFARLLTQGDPLIRDMEKKLGPSVFLRQFARIHEIMTGHVVIRDWIKSVHPKGPFYRETPRLVKDGMFFGWHEVHRGALAHWAEFKDNRIVNYQIIAPTTWNIGPRDALDQPGAVEQTVMDIPVEDPTNPVGLQHALRSYDLCLVCTVHAVQGGREVQRFTLGL